MNNQEKSKLSCNLNTNVNVSDYKTKQNIIAPKLQRIKKGLHFGAQKVDPDLFTMKEKENIRKTPNIILQQSNFQIENDDLRISTLDEESEDEKTTEGNESARATENYLLGLGNGPEHTHSAQQSMVSIHQYWSNKHCLEKTEESASKNITDYGFNKKHSTSASKKYNPDETYEARRKFGSAKSISSDQFFGSTEDTAQYKSDLLRFKNSSAISSDEFFQRPPSDPTLRDVFGSPLTVDELSECLRKGVNKVAGKLGSAVNDFITRMPHEFGEF